MPKIATPLTDYVVRTLKPQRGAKSWREVSDGGCRGLMLRLSPRGEKKWAVRATSGGERRLATLGAYPALGLADARQKAAEYLSHMRGGLRAEDLDARLNAESMTLVDLYVRYIKAVQVSLAARTITTKEAMFRAHIEPVAGKRLIRAIRRADVVEVVEAVRMKGLMIQSNRVFSEFMALLRWAEQKGFIGSVPSFHKFKLKEQSRGRTLTEPEIKTFWCHSNDLGLLTRDFLRLLLLTGQRRDEVRLMSWEELDLDNALWKIPSARYKSRHDQVVPLSKPVLAILQAHRSEGATGYVLSGRTKGNPFNGAASAMRRLRKALPRGGDYTLHDLRRTCRTGLSRLGVDEQTAELVIGHRPQGIVKTYDIHHRLEERREALKRWAEYVLSVAGEGRKNVVPLVASE